jgi:2-succinyl-5-enolpyruvyl-6-hydroxy-3-cyclohexene-1-carboxylate synthase
LVTRPGEALGRDLAGDRADVVRLLTASLRNGTAIASTDRAYLTQLVAARSGLSQADADARVSEVLTELKTATDIARRVSAQLALWIAASMLLGALAAALAATEGGGLREGTWTYERI